jgi:hypothetical protein
MTRPSIARILWAFDLSPAVDSEGRDIPVDIFAYTNSTCLLLFLTELVVYFLGDREADCFLPSRIQQRPFTVPCQNNSEVFGSCSAHREGIRGSPGRVQSVRELGVPIR